MTPLQLHPTMTPLQLHPRDPLFLTEVAQPIREVVLQLFPV
jgi:hypothetical protein